MAQVNLYKQDGTQAGKISLAEALFDVAPHATLVHEAIVIQEANSRVRLAHVKDRSEVAGTGKKPWRQKGTGRARHGSRRSPIWVGGGITFGPNPFRNFAKKINKKVKRKALAMALTDKTASERLIVVDSFAFPEAKTKLVAQMRAALPGAGRSTLFVTAAGEKEVITGAQNLPKTATIGARNVNVRDIVKYQFVVISQDGLKELEQTFIA